MASAADLANDQGALFVNGRILTRDHAGLEDEPTFADSMFVKHGVIQAIGSESEIATRYAADGVTSTDLNQKTVLPGFIDGHMHLLLLGQSLCKVSLDHCKTFEDIRSTLKEYAVKNPNAPRILAKGWMHSMTPDGATASLLDDIDLRPIHIDAKDLHAAWCNTAALSEMGIAGMPDPAGGKIHRDANGTPSGVLSEGAFLSIVLPYQALMAAPAEREDAILAAIRNYNSSGITGLVEMAMDEYAWDSLVSLRAKQPDLSMRIAAYWLIKPSDDPGDCLKQVHRAVELNAELNATTSPDLRIAGIKIVCDGVIDACTAYLSEPYTPIDSASPRPLWTYEDLELVVKAADEAGLQIALHAIGDGAIKMAADVLEKNTQPGRRHRIEHLELASAEDAERLGKLGITASIQPVHADPAILRAWPRLLGEARHKRAFPYREFADSGALLALGTDSPTAPWEPLKNVYVGTTRRSAREPEDETVVNENFRLGVCEAIVAGTKGAAASVFAEERTGSLSVGKMADFVVVDMEWDAKSLLRAEIKETYFSGRRL
ncbi:hypothetical protein ACJ41O_006184 [Fusarium nematophilum]